MLSWEVLNVSPFPRFRLNKPIILKQVMLGNQCTSHLAWLWRRAKEGRTVATKNKTKALNWSEHSFEMLIKAQTIGWYACVFLIQGYFIFQTILIDGTEKFVWENNALQRNRMIYFGSLAVPFNNIASKCSFIFKKHIVNMELDLVVPCVDVPSYLDGISTEPIVKLSV